jgi:hypothetical protein
MNASTISGLILAKQSITPYRLVRDGGIVLAIITVLIVLGQFVEPSSSHRSYESFAITMVLLAIFEIGGYAFREFKQKSLAIQWMTLPANTMEKWLANWLTSFFLVPLVFLVLLSLSTILGNAVIFLLGGSELLVPVFNPISKEGWFCLKAYWIVHPILFFGAIYFKKRPVLKTFGSVALLLLALILYVGFVGDWIFADTFENQASWEEQYMDEMNEEEFFIALGEHLRVTSEGFALEALAVLKAIGKTLSILYFPFFWGLSFLRLKELDL